MFSLKAEELIRRSPREKRVGSLLDEVNKIKAEKVAQIAILFIYKASGCIISGYKHKLPSAAQSVFSTFHQLRRSREMNKSGGCLYPLTFQNLADKSLNLHCSYCLIDFSRNCSITKQMQRNKALQAHKPTQSGHSLQWKAMPSGICLAMWQ